MSSETSTERHESLQPWQLFTLAGLLGATMVVFFTRGESQPFAAIILLSCTIFAAAYVGVTALRTALPLAGTVHDDTPETLGERSRAALEREKTLALRSIKELEFDRGMGKVSEKDFAEMSSRLRARAARLMRQLDAGSLYREQIEKEVEKLVEANVGRTLSGPPGGPDKARPTYKCGSCAALNDPDARFCKNCGARLETAS